MQKIQEIYRQNQQRLFALQLVDGNGNLIPKDPKDLIEGEIEKIKKEIKDIETKYPDLFPFSDL
jgi:hypothetical protein